jgi:hypothetical protein
MKRNIALNGLGPTSAPSSTSDDAMAVDGASTSTKPRDLGKVRVNEGDAWCASFLASRSLATDIYFTVR